MHTRSNLSDDLATAQPSTPETMFQLGIKLRVGAEGVSQNSAAAFTFIQQAAVKGNLPEAHIALGEMHLAGEGTPVNAREAANSFARAINAGDPSGNLKLADMYLHGNGVSQSDKMAFRFTAEAVIQDVAEGQFRLGGMFERGIGTSVQPEKAENMYRLAAEQGHSGALAKIGEASPATVRPVSAFTL